MVQVAMSVGVVGLSRSWLASLAEDPAEAISNYNIDAREWITQLMKLSTGYSTAYQS